MYMKLKNISSIYTNCLVAAATFLLCISCNKNLPTLRDSLSDGAQFTQTSYSPTLGRTTLMDNNFSSDNSSLPLTFNIVNLRRYNGDAAPELTEKFPVTVWKQAYTGLETSLDEIENKREIQYRPLFDLWVHSGQFVMWSPANSSFVRSQPDSGYLFDVELSNSGGLRYLRGLRLTPYRERPFETSNQDVITGNVTNPPIYPNAASNIYGVRTDGYLSSGDIQVFFYKNSSSGNSLTFKFLDSLYRPIDPAKFSLTNWPGLVHGQLRQMNADSVIYDVLYPIPLAVRPTAYTNTAGDRASVKFQYARLGFGQIREVANLQLDFAIYDPGDWLIVFWFKRDSPKFEND